MVESPMRIFDFLLDSTVIFFIANFLYVISYTLTSMVWLRILAIIAAASTLPYFYLQSEPLWSAIFWQLCFLTVNLVNLSIILFSMRTTNFNEDEELAYDLKFSKLKRHEIRPIFNSAKRTSPDVGAKLLVDGDQNDLLFLILEGSCKIMKNEAEIAVLGAGDFVGELSFMSDHAVSADVIAAENTKLMYWDDQGLTKLFKQKGLYESYFNSLLSMDVASKLRTETTANAASAA
jgi:CRP-like cAMP-binding protein